MVNDMCFGIPIEMCCIESYDNDCIDVVVKSITVYDEREKKERVYHTPLSRKSLNELYTKKNLRIQLFEDIRGVEELEYGTFDKLYNYIYFKAEVKFHEFDNITMVCRENCGPMICTDNMPCSHGDIYKLSWLLAHLISSNRVNPETKMDIWCFNCGQVD